MKKILFLSLTFSFLSLFAQNKSTVETRALMQSYRNAKSVAEMPQWLTGQLAVRSQKGVDCIGVLAKVNGSFDKTNIEKRGIKVTSRVANIVSMRVPLPLLETLETEPGIEVFSVAHRVEPMMDKTRVDTRTDSVQAGLGVPMPFDGEGVIIGITDWGFDYTHPNINSRTKQRILRAWDHYKLSGPAPEGFDYGTEFVGYSELKAAKGDTSGLYGYGTHGTHVAGICGGNGTGGHVIGQAPGAKFLLGSWYLDEAAWLDQVAWMYKVSKEEDKRLVINSSWGMYTISTIDGTSLLSQGIDAYADSGIVFVTSGGNNGNDKFHLKHVFGESDTLTSIATYLSSGVGQALIYWGEPGENNQFEVAFAAVKNNNSSVRYYSPFFATADDITYLDSFIVAGNDTIHFNLMTESSNPLDGRSHALLNVSKSNNFKLMMMCRASEGVKVNIWNVGNVENHAGNTGCDFMNDGVYGCQNGDYNYGIGEPACASHVISVAAHSSDHYRSDTIYTTGDIASFSSYGPTLDGRDKPDISAPGVNVVSSISSWCDLLSNYTAIYSTINSGRAYIWSSMSGTSMSCPAVSGVIALMLQANPRLTFDEIYEILTSTARNDDKTGNLHANDSISPRWGHGKVDALRAVNEAYDRFVAIGKVPENEPSLVAFPNPASDMVIVRTGSNMPLNAQLFSIDGRLMMEKTICGEASLDLSAMNRGVYMLRVAGNNSVRTTKIVKN